MSAAAAIVDMVEAKANPNKLTANVNATGVAVAALKNNKPWVEIRPLATPRDDFRGVPNETLEAIHETEAFLEDPKRTTYKFAEDIFESLGL